MCLKRTETTKNWGLGTEAGMNNVAFQQAKVMFQLSSHEWTGKHRECTGWPHLQWPAYPEQTGYLNDAICAHFFAYRQIINRTLHISPMYSVVSINYQKMRNACPRFKTLAIFADTFLMLTAVWCIVWLIVPFPCWTKAIFFLAIPVTGNTPHGLQLSPMLSPLNACRAGSSSSDAIIKSPFTNKQLPRA